MAWKKVDLIDVSPPPTPITLIAVTYDGRTYGAGRCFVRLGLLPATPCYALRAHEEQRILASKEESLAWLTIRGLPCDVGAALLEAVDLTEEKEDTALHSSTETAQANKGERGFPREREAKV